MDSLLVDLRVEATRHLASVLSLGWSPEAARVDCDHRGTDLEGVSAEEVIRFAVEARVGEYTVEGDEACSLLDGWRKEWCIVSRPSGNGCADPEVARGVADDGQFWPAARDIDTAVRSVIEEVLAGVTNFVAGGVECPFSRSFDQAASEGDVDNDPLQSVESPFFRRRCSAF